MRYRAFSTVMLVAIVVAILSVPTPAVAAEAANSALTLDEAVKIAYGSNYEVQKLRLRIAALEEEIKLLTTEEYYTIGDKLKEDLAELKKSLDSTLLRTERAVKDSFNSIVAIYRQIQAQDENIVRTEQRHSAEKILQRHGLSTETVLRELELAMRQSENALKLLHKNRETAYMNLNILLGRPASTTVFILLDSAEETVKNLDFLPELIDWDESLALALVAEHGPLKRALDNYEDAQEEYRELELKYYYYEYPLFTSGGYLNRVDIIRAKLKVHTMALALDEAKSIVEVNLFGLFQAVIEAEEHVYIGMQELELQRQKLLYEEKKYEVGLATQASVLNQLNKVTACEVDLAARIYGYERALLSLRQAEQGL